MIATVHVEAEWDRFNQVGETNWLTKVNAQFGMPNAIVGHVWLAAKNTDNEDIFPTQVTEDGEKANNWIQVGASSSSKKKKKIIARFSNYGSNTVDLFAPGVNIYSTVPDNKYEDASGTSMASPVVSGVAALIWSYFPELSATELKDVILKTVEPYSKKVRCPGSKEKVYMTDLCKTAGFVSAENAVR